jgi:hypothetical protein
MDVLRTPPNQPYANMQFALLIGAFVGSIVYAGVEAVLYGARITAASLPFDVFSLAIFALIAGEVLILMYVLPLYLLLKRSGFVGPLVAFLVGLIPAGVAAAVGLQRTAWPLLAYGTSVALLFVVLAYRRVAPN